MRNDLYFKTLKKEKPNEGQQVFIKGKLEADIPDYYVCYYGAYGPAGEYGFVEADGREEKFWPESYVQGWVETEALDTILIRGEK